MVDYAKWPIRFLCNYLCSSEARYCIHRSLFDGNVSVSDTSALSTMKHLQAAIAWILNAQALQSDGGVSAYIAYSGKKVVGTSYPEVTGYIITTMINYYELCGEQAILDAANKMVDFEINIQMKSGSFPAGHIGGLSKESVFNSAQVVDGLLSYYRKTGQEYCLRASIKCCDWIISVQDDDGAWGTTNYLDSKRTYDTKVSEALLKLHSITGDQALVIAANQNLEWVISNQNDNGWFRNCDNSLNKVERPRNHAIGYTIHGLIECFAKNGDRRLLAAACKASDPLVNRVLSLNHPLEGRFDSNWRPKSHSADVVGSAQLSICWQYLFEITGKQRYFDAALKMNGFLKGIQFMDGPTDLYGAVPSAYPFWGEEVPFGITSWAVKYFADALMNEYRHRVDGEQSLD